MRKILLEFVPGLLGGVVGGVLGYFVVGWISRQGFYAMILPGALVGLGCGQASSTRSNVRGVVSALMALIAGLISEWLVFYHPAERTVGSFVEFLSKFGQQPMVTPIMIAVGTLFGYWWGREERIGSIRGGPRRPEG